jgi:hypothetical protein
MIETTDLERQTTTPGTDGKRKITFDRLPLAGLFNFYQLLKTMSRILDQKSQTSRIGFIESDAGRFDSSIFSMLRSNADVHGEIVLHAVNLSFSQFTSSERGRFIKAGFVAH